MIKCIATIMIARNREGLHVSLEGLLLSGSIQLMGDWKPNPSQMPSPIEATSERRGAPLPSCATIGKIELLSLFRYSHCMAVSKLKGTWLLLWAR